MLEDFPNVVTIKTLHDDTPPYYVERATVLHLIADGTWKLLVDPIDTLIDTVLG